MGNGTAELPGLRRVEWIRLVVGDGVTRAEAIGVGYRLPVTVPIPVSLAVRLAGEGVPFVLSHPEVRVAHPAPSA
jgi:hypothetical protein